jgi:hypothetical protein
MRRLIAVCVVAFGVMACGVTEEPAVAARQDALDAECKVCDRNLICTKDKTGQCQCECLAAQCYGCPADE